MDEYVFRGILTGVLLLAFVGLWIAAWSKKRKADYDAAAMLPFDDDDEVVDGTGALEVHVTGTKTVDSGMTHQSDRVFMGGQLRPPEYSRSVTDEERVRELVRLTKPSDSA